MPRKGLRPENFEWGLGTGKRKGQSRVTWTLEARVGNRLQKGLTGHLGVGGKWGARCVGMSWKPSQNLAPEVRAEMC